MLILRDPAGASRIADSDVRTVVQHRLHQLNTFDDGLLMVVESYDSTEALERVSGCALLSDPFNGMPYGHPDFTPSFDFLLEHRHVYEMHFDTSDDGIGITLFIPKTKGIDPSLLAMCSEYAVPAVAQTPG
jgi:hypothetical protein